MSVAVGATGRYGGVGTRGNMFAFPKGPLVVSRAAIVAAAVGCVDDETPVSTDTDTTTDSTSYVGTQPSEPGTTTGYIGTPPGTTTYVGTQPSDTGHTGTTGTGTTDTVHIPPHPPPTP